MIDSQPDLAPLIRRVRGGYLKIQGTWMPYEVRFCSHFKGHYRSSLTSGCTPTLSPVGGFLFLFTDIFLNLKPRVAYNIREDLVPLFGYAI